MEEKETKSQNNQNGLNNCSLAALYDLFMMSKSASYEVMTKMREYESFGGFLGAAYEASDKDFIPAIAPRDVEPENVEQ